MTTTTGSRGKLLATVFVIAAIVLIVFATFRSHTIDKRDVADLWGCDSIEGKPLFTLTADVLATPTARTAFIARQGRRSTYLDLASPMRLVKHGASLTFDPSPEPTGPIEAHRSTPRALLLPSASGPPILALRSECPA